MKLFKKLFRVLLLGSIAVAAVAQNNLPGTVTTEGGINPVDLTSSGTDTYVGSLHPNAPLKSYQGRACYTFTPNFDSVGPASLNLDTLGAKQIVRQDGSALEDGDLKSGQPHIVCFSDFNNNLVGIGIRSGGSGGGGGGSGSPGGSGSNLQYRIDGSTFGGVSGTSVSGSRITYSGMVDLAGQGKLPRGSSLPISCEDGEVYTLTSAPSGRRLYSCEAGGWVLQGDGGGNNTATGCISGPGIYVPETNRPTCGKGTATDPNAWGGLDFPDPDTGGTTSVILETMVPTGWNGVSAPDLQLTYVRPGGVWTTGAKFLFSVKTQYMPDGATAGSESYYDDGENFGPEALNDVSPTGADVLNLNQKFTSTVRSLHLGSTSPNVAAPKIKMRLILSRQKNGAGGRVDTLDAPIRIIDASLRWTTGTRVTTTVGTTGTGTSVTLANVNGLVTGASQVIIIAGAGTAAANYVGTVSSINTGTKVVTLAGSTSTAVPANTLVAVEASLFDFTWHFTGTGPTIGTAGGGGLTGSQLYDDVREWTRTTGSTCDFNVNTPTSSSPGCIVNTGSDPESGVQFSAGATSCVTFLATPPPAWDGTTAPTMFLSWNQVGGGASSAGNLLMNVATWSVAENATYNSPSYSSVSCTVQAGGGDLKKLSMTCPSLSITGAGAGRDMKIRVCRAGTGSDTLTTPAKVYKSRLRWTLTSACPAP